MEVYVWSQSFEIWMARQEEEKKNMGFWSKEDISDHFEMQYHTTGTWQKNISKPDFQVSVADFHIEIKGRQWPPEVKCFYVKCVVLCHHVQFPVYLALSGGKTQLKSSLDIIFKQLKFKSKKNINNFSLKWFTTINKRLKTELDSFCRLIFVHLV